MIFVRESKFYASNHTIARLTSFIPHSSDVMVVLRLPGTISLNVLRNASLQVTLTVPEVVDTEN